jgi:glucosyl-dolichyl phosphate glucuronosyltransferase
VTTLATESSKAGQGEPDAAGRRPTVSVVVCAYTEKRWDDLVAAVASCGAQTVPPLETIVVVDHNPNLLRRLRLAMPHVRLVENAEEQGLSGARNSGVRAAAGDVVAFLDDDATTAPDWLEHLTSAYLDERVIGAGGSVEPVWPNTRPATMPPEFDWVLGCTYRGLPTCPGPVRNMIGANMSLRRELIEDVGGFRNGIGRNGSRPLGCEETEICIRARQRRPDAIILYEPRARVYHRVPSERMSWRYFGRRCYAEGLSKAAVVAYAGSADGLASERSYTLRTLPSGVLRGVADTLSRRDIAGVARAFVIVAGLLMTTIGYAVGRVRERSDSRRS